jgi:hypothetical protein
MKIKSQKDFWSGLMFVVIGLAFAGGATSYSLGRSANPGPGYFPLGLGLLLAVLGALVLFKSLTLETDNGEPVGHLAWRPLLWILGGVVVFGLALVPLGLLVALPLLVLIASHASDEFTWRAALLNAAVLTLMCWGVFIVGLKLTIPLWPSVLGLGG